MSPSTVSTSSPARLVRGLEARASTRTAYPALMSARTTADPTKPVAPVTSTRPTVTASPAVSNPQSSRRIEQMHAPQVGAQSYAVTGVPRGFGWQPGDHLERRDLEEHERIGPQGLDHRCRHFDGSGIDVALGPGQVFRPQAEDHFSSDPIAIGRRILGRNDERPFAAQSDHERAVALLEPGRNEVH